jgi:SAM-dependent methyltransferase
MPVLPPYFEALIAARRAGQVGRHVHLGYWDDPPPLTAPPHPGEFENAQSRLTARLIDLVPLRSDQSVLDVACGFGGTLATIDARMTGVTLTGLNIDSRQLTLCRDAVTRPDNILTLVTADACALPFRDKSFDHVFCVEAMFHFASRRRFLAEAARALRPGGSLTISDILLRPPISAPWDDGKITEIIRRDYGPWPDPWADIAYILSTANGFGLEPTNMQDWTAATLPSYRIVAPNARTPQHPSAGEVFRWLHLNGYLTYPALSFRRR